MSWRATMLGRDYDALMAHLFQDDRDEHAAFLYAGLVDQRLLVRRVVAVADEEFVPSSRGAYRQITARAVARAARECDELGLCLLWAHSHPLSRHAVDFSHDDLAAHRYAHPALIDMTHGRPVAGLVFGADSVAGEIWTSDAPPARLESLRVLGRHVRDLYPEPPSGVARAASRFARQVLMFGDTGQEILRRLAIAVVGVGGGGSLLAQQLAHLGVGRLVLMDFDSVSETNLSRIVGATAADVGRPKVDVVGDYVATIDDRLVVERVCGDIGYAGDARRLGDVDFAFLATDSILSRYAFNLVCHQYLVPGIQVGAKVTTDTPGGVSLVHVMERPVMPGEPCLDCAGVIPEEELADEQLNPAERQAQRYVDDLDDAEVAEPSVITLNGIAASEAATDFLFMFTGLLRADLVARVWYPQTREVRTRVVARRAGCRVCDGASARSVLARGDLRTLALRPGAFPAIATPASSPAARPWRRLVRLVHLVHLVHLGNVLNRKESRE